MDIAGAAPEASQSPDAFGPAGVGEQGIGTEGFSRNLGGPDRLPANESRDGDRTMNPRPAVGALDRWERNDGRDVGYCRAKETERGERDAGRRSVS